MKPLRFAIFGAGFWTRCQLAAWREINGVECVAIYNRTASKAEAIARGMGIPKVYDDPEKLLREMKPDFVDNITEIGGHKPLSLLCAKLKIPCICQKPMAASLEDAKEIVAKFAEAGTTFLVHENWRWQLPIRQLRNLVALEVIGQPFRARLTVISGLDYFANQPALKELKQFILTDLGTHLLDSVRSCFGEVASLYCQTQKTLAPEVQGENVATMLLRTAKTGMSVTVEMAYAKNPIEHEGGPQTLAFVEGPRGTIELTGDYWVRTTTEQGTHCQRHAPPRYAWADPRYEMAQASIVDCHRDLLKALRGEGDAETSGADNLKTMELVFAAYESARTGRVIHFDR